MRQSQPDLLVVGGYVPEIGIDPALDASRQDGRPTAVAVSGRRISAVGGEELRALAGPDTQVLEADGGAILPGLNDGHLHFCGSAVTRYLLLDISAATDWAGVRDLVMAAEPGTDGWIRAHGWDEVVHGPIEPTAFHRLRPETPVVAYDMTGHQLLVNEAGLGAVGLADAVADLPGGTIGRLDDGRPNGHMVDGAMSGVNELLPELPAEDLRAALLCHQADLHACGITSLTEPGLGPGGVSLLGAAAGTPSLLTLLDLAESGELTLRITALLLLSATGGATAAETRAGLESGLAGLARVRGIDPLLLNISGVKIFADGTPRSGTAWMSEEYRTPCGQGHGHLVIAGDTDEARTTELRKIISAVVEAGLQAGIHATGDASTRAAVDAIEDATASAMVGGRDRVSAPHYIIHGAFADSAALERLASVSVGYSTNPAIRAGAGQLMRDVLGTARFAAHQPLASALRQGILPTIASDAPVTHYDWRNSVVAAVSRDTTAGPGTGDAERITLSQALALMTLAPAEQDGAAADKGAIAPGQLADLCVLADPLPVNVDRLRTIPTLATIVDGRVVHAADNLQSRYPLTHIQTRSTT